MNEVAKVGMTAAEIEVLRAIHGPDAVVDIAKTGDAKRTHAEERARLYQVYANPDANTTESLKKKMDMMRGLFGHDRLPLPETLADLASEEVVTAQEEEQAAPVAPVRTRVTKAQAPAFAE